MRTQAAWKVDTHIFSATGPTRPTRRDFISSAALLVKVMARISQGRASPVAIRWPTRRVSTRVLPDPAPATTSRGPPRWTTARRWGSFRSSSRTAGAGTLSLQRGFAGHRRPPAVGDRATVDRRRALTDRAVIDTAFTAAGVGDGQIVELVDPVEGTETTEPVQRGTRHGHSHSMVPGGFDVMSRATRLTPSTSLMIREDSRSRRS